MNYNNFIARFNGVKQTGTNQYMALCPAHEDHNHSLSISLSDDGTKILIYCFAGCSTEEILQKSGLNMADLFLVSANDKKQIIHQTSYTYYNADGSIAYTKTRIDNHQQIDKNLFNSVLKDITDVYPLWDRMCKGWSIEQIKTDLEKYLSYFHDRAQQLRTLLGIPASYENYKQPDTPVCTYIINYMSKSSTSLIEDAISAYLEYLHKQQEQRNEEARRKAEEARQRQIEREESGYYDQPSSGGGFLSSMLSTAGGVALGNKVSGNNRRNSDNALKRMREDDRRRESERRRQEALDSQREWQAVKKANEERRRKGQPELPLPQRKWY